MLVDNHSTDFKVHSFIQQYINDGSMDIVTGYFTVGALCHFANLTNEKIAQYRIILGDITQRDVTEISSLDLLNADLSLEKALSLKKLANDAVDFLKLNKVSLKTLQPNFCIYSKVKKMTGRRIFISQGAPILQKRVLVLNNLIILN